MIVSALAAGALFAAVLLLVQRAVRALVLPLIGGGEGGRSYLTRDGWAYSAFLLFGAGGLGLRLSIPLVYLVLGSFVVAQVLLALHTLHASTSPATDAPSKVSFFDSTAWLAILFLLSGMAALVYEVVWQRVLFSVYGVNIESVTMVVALFMFGLGLGALVGGTLARRHPNHVPLLFAASELAIGAFGAVSVPLIGWVGSHTLHLPPAAVGATVFGLLLVPVLLMGATLPLLVQHLTRHDPNVGAVLGRLYALNTLGAAIASVLTVDLLFVFFGRQATIFVAVALNVVVAVLVARFAMRLRSRSQSSAASPVEERAPSVASAETMPRWAVLTVAFLGGFISLSQEIVWMRPIGYATQGAPQVFGQVLGVFLFGLAAGAWKAKKLCEAGVVDPIRRLGNTFMVAGVLYYLAQPLFGAGMVISRGLGVPLAYGLIGAIAYLMGLVLPLLAQLDGGSPSSGAGRKVAIVYFANVAGATAGPLLTGFVLLDRLSFAQCALVVTAMTFGTGASLRMFTERSRRPSRGAVVGTVAFAAMGLVLYGPLYLHLPERLREGPSYSPADAFAKVVENRSGVLAVRHDPDGDVMYGGGTYDGTFNLLVALRSNDIARAFMVGALHPRPRRVLQIGLSTGSWTWVVASHEAVESITVVEINPGYEEVIQAYPRQREVLHDPKVALVYDDGRRWLARHPDAKFDFVLMNTTYHWRSNMTNLLSREFLALCRAHLEPGGVVYFNTTHNPDAGRTAADVFEHVANHRTFVAASDSPFDMSVAQRRASLLGFRRGGVSLFEAEGPHGLGMLELLANFDLSDRGTSYREAKELRVITDDNMLPEFKRVYGDTALGALYRWHGPERSWADIVAGK